MGRATLVSYGVAALACFLPFVTHFADSGISLVLHLAWIAIAVDVLRRHGRQGAWVLIGAPFALFWPVSFLWWLLFEPSIRLF